MVGDTQGVTSQSPLQSDFQPEVLLRLRLLLGSIEPHLVAARTLGLVHREIRVAQQDVRFFSVVQGERNSYACADRDASILLLVDEDGLVRGLQNAPGDMCGSQHVTVLQNGEELFSAEAAGHIPRSGSGCVERFPS